MIIWLRIHVKLISACKALSAETATDLTIAAIARTFLSRHRTIQTSATSGMIIARILQMLYSLEPNPDIGFVDFSLPLSPGCHAPANVTSVLGAFKCIRYPRIVARANALAGGFELKCIGCFTTLITTSWFLGSDNV